MPVQRLKCWKKSCSLNYVEQIVYKLWVSTDRSTLETFCSPVEEFAETFCKKIELLRPHSFIAIEQASFYAHCKATLKMGEFLVTADFSENYSFILQDAAQGFHWNNSQATLYPFVTYYLDSGEVHHVSYVVISDCLHHDTIAVFTFTKNLSLPFWKNCCQLDCILKRLSIFLLGLHHNTKTGKISWICVTTRMILESKLNGIFQPFHTERGLWWSGWNHQTISYSYQLAKAIQWPTNDTTSVVRLGM